MATVKNYGLAGVAACVQYGKGNGQFCADGASDFKVTTDGSTLSQLSVATTPTDVNHATSKQYVDSVVTGLDVKNSVRASTASVNDLTGFVYTPSSDDGTAEAAAWTSVTAPVFDGITLVDGDRVLIKDAAGADAPGNGIWTYNASDSTFERATDADNTPSNEVSGGMFTFVEEGDTLADNGYVMASPEGNADLGTDDIVMSQFSGAGQITAGDGLTKSGNTINAVGSDTIIANANDLEVNSSNTAGQILISGGTAGTAATFGALDLDNANAVTGTLGISNGGTNLAAIADRSVLVSTAADTLSVLTVGVSSVDQLLLWDDSADDFVFVDSDTIGSAYNTIDADAGDDVVANGSETLQLRGGASGGIQTTGASGTPDAVTIDIVGADLTTGAVELALADFIIVNDSTDTATDVSLKYTFSDVVDDLNIPHGTALNATGGVYRIAVDDGGDDYTVRTITASVVAGDQGISIVAGNGVSGNPTIGLDITGLTVNTVTTGTDELVTFDGTNNTKVSISTLISDNVLAWTTITADVSGPVNASSSTDTIALLGGLNGGITTTGTDGEDTVNFTLTPIDLTTGTSDITFNDFIIISQSGDGATDAPLKYTFDQVVDQLDIPHDITVVGLVVKSAEDTYVSRTIELSAVAGDEGISVVNGSGAAGNPTIGLDIDGLTLNTVLSGSDKLVIFDGTNNRKVNASEFVTDNVLSFTTINIDTGGPITADSSADSFDLVGLSNGGICTTTTGANNISFDIVGADLATGGATLALADFFIVNDENDNAAATSLKYTFSDLVDDLDIPHGTALNALGAVTRIATDDGGNDYTVRSIAVSVVAGDEGLSIVDGPGTSGNPTVGLDITGLLLNTVLSGSDELVLFDGVNNRKVTVDSFTSSGDQNLWLNFAADAGGPTAADNTTDTWTFTGGSGISTSITGDVLTITNDAPQVDDTQNLWETIVSDSGSTTADTLTDSLSILGSTTAGLEGIATSITGDILTVGLNINGLTNDVGSVALNAGGASHEVNDLLTLAGGTGTFATITVDTVGTILSQDETDFAVFVGGDGAGGTAHVAADVLTLTDGTTITVDTVDGDGDVLTFTVLTTSTSGNANLATIAQSSSTGTGTDFSITLGVVNQAVFGFTLTTTGAYTVDPTPLIANPVTTDGSGTGATFDITMSGVDDTDVIVIFDGTNNRKVTVAALIGDIDNTIIIDGDGDTSVDVEQSDDNDTIIFTALTVEAMNITSTAITATVPVFGANGSETAPTYSFTNGADTGIYLESASPDTLCITVDSKDVHCFRIQSGATGDEHLVSEAGDGEGRLCAEGDDTNVDIRICPKGTGSVFLGDPGSSATIATSDGENATDNGEDLTIQTGDGNTTGRGGDILILGGDGGGTAGADGGDITLTPGSSVDNDVNGIVCITDSNSVNVTCFEGVASAVNNFVMTNSATGSGPQLEAEGSDTNIDIRFLPKGTGVLSVTGTTDYEDNVTDDDDIPNKKFVDDAIAVGTSSHQVTLYDTLNDDGLVTGTNSVPLNADITRVVVNVTSVYGGTQGFDIGTAAASTRVVTEAADEVDWQTVGTYIIENHELASDAASLFLLTKANASTGTGAGTIRVEFTLDV